MFERTISATVTMNWALVWGVKSPFVTLSRQKPSLVAIGYALTHSNSTLKARIKERHVIKYKYMEKQKLGKIQV